MASDGATDGKSSRGLATAGILLTVVLIVGFTLIFKIADSQRDAGLRDWNNQLDLVADSRAQAVSAWLNRHLKSVEDLANNATLQFYVSSLAMDGAAEGQRGYVFSLLSAEAARQGFHEIRPLDQIAANVTRPRQAGLALIQDDKALVATAGMPLVRQQLWAGRDRSFITVTFEDNKPLLIFGTPIAAAEGMDIPGSITWLIGAKPMNEEFFATLTQPGDQTKTSENYLVAEGDTDGLIRQLSPLRGGGKLGSNRQDNAATGAALTPHAFDTAINYNGVQVLVTGRQLSAPVPWTLVRTITTEEAMSEINARRNSLIISLSLAVLVVVVMLAFAWKMGTSRRLEKAFSAQAKLSAKNAELSHFLQAVSDSQPSSIAAIDSNLKFKFANTAMGDLASLPAKDLIGRQMETAFNKDQASLIKASVLSALEGDHSQSVIDYEVADESKNLKLVTLPIRQPNSDKKQALMVLQDITDLVAARRKAEDNLKQLVRTLTQIIDARDPWSQYHSARVSEVSMNIAAEMAKGMRQIETVRTAGQLMNLGKIFVSSEILTKHGQLSDSELEMVRQSMDKGASLLDGLDFGGPVSTALKQVREHVDGSGGPAGITGGDMLDEAKILSVANAFVGMVSSRAHRAGFTFDKAVAILLEQADKKFDRKVVAALQNILENKGGKERWQSYSEAVDE